MYILSHSLQHFPESGVANIAQGRTGQVFFRQTWVPFCKAIRHYVNAYSKMNDKTSILRLSET